MTGETVQGSNTPAATTAVPVIDTPLTLQTAVQTPPAPGLASQRQGVPQASPAPVFAKTTDTPPLVLVVLDGWGVAPPSRANAISMARTPRMDQLMQDYPTVTLYASGEEVGLPYNEMGNSEVGHLNIGAGKIVYQNLPRIDKAITSGRFFENPTLKEAIQEVKKRGSKLHLMGLTSFGGIHSSQEHLYALLDFCKKEGVNENVFIHAFLDGRDTARNAALESIAKLETKMEDIGIGRIASLSGRFWSMDRDNRWERIEAAFNAIRFGHSQHQSESPLKAIEDAYRDDIFDEEFRPTVIQNADGTPVASVGDNDVVIFFNFRADRARQLTKAFVLPGLEKFNRGQPLNNVVFVTMTEYERNLPVRVAYSQDDIQFPVARVISDNGIRQLHIAETEKYAHVTFFFNGGAEDPFPGEDRALVPSPRVMSYDEQPAMSAPQITEKVVAALDSHEYGFIVVNLANPDMVGHTGNFQATVAAVEETDAAIGTIADTVARLNGTLLITADHGNAEKKVDIETGEISKEHTTNAVPCILANEELKAQRAMWPPVLDGDVSRLQPVGVLSDVGPTILTLMHLPVPKQMTGRSLIRMT